jgi:KaiC/GvpD/RAD55 family RecA-like ATPase
VTLLDDWLAGVRDGGTHILTGGPGCGKSTIALQFADAGLRLGESVAMVVHARTDHVKSHAAYLGIDLETALRDGRLLLLRYRSDFARRAAHAVAPEQVIADLERIISSSRPGRIIIETFSPFVTTPPPVAPVVAALAHMLERFDVTSLLTFPEDLAPGYDRNLEPLVESAAAVIRLAHDEGEVRRAELLSIRDPAPSAATRSFVIRQGVGIVAEHTMRPDRLTLRVQ